MIEDLCEKLKRKREKLGYSMEKAVEMTKLHPSVIKAIEDGRLNEINPTYLKGFIKLYASFLKVDIGNELALPDSGKASDTKPSSKVDDSFARSYSRKMGFINTFLLKFKKYIIPILTLSISFAAVVLIIFFIGRLARYKAPSSASRNESIETVSTKPEVPYNGRGVSVSIKARRDCFIKVRRDGNIVFEGILKKGVVESWHAEKELEFSINDGSSVIVEINGRILPSLSKIYKPIKSLKITPKSISIVK